MTTSELIQKIDAERRGREKQLSGLLLIFALRTRRYAVHAVKLAIDPLVAIQRTWLGSEHFTGVDRPLSNAMVSAHTAAYQRTARMVQVPIDVSQPLLMDLYKSKARTVAEQMLDTLETRVWDAIASTSDSREQVKAIWQTYTDGGYTLDNPSALNRAAELVVVQADSDGVAHAAQRPDAEFSGFKHHSVYDAGTTVICKQRSGLTLPRNDPYWLENWPMLHFGCRSIVLPVIGSQQWSTEYPKTPAADGWGIMPTWLPGITRRAA